MIYLLTKLRILFICTVLFVFGCATNEPTASLNTVPSRSPTPDIDAQNTRRAEIEAGQQRAITEFLAQNYPGWTLAGESSGFGACFYNELCDLHLQKGSTNKVIKVVIRRFSRPDKTTYWFVYEAHPIDLIGAKIEEIEEESFASGTESVEHAR